MANNRIISKFIPLRIREQITAGISPAIKPAANVDIAQLDIQIEESRNIECFVFTPKIKTLRTIFYLPGTASMAECWDASKAISSNLASILACQVILIYPGKSKENQFPIPTNDACIAINYLLQNADKFNINLKHLGLAGYSSGGLLAIQICMQTLLQRAKLPFKQVLLLAPVVDLTCKPREYKKDADFFEEKFFRDMVRNYVPNNMDSSLPIFSPTNNLSKSFKGFPPISIIYGENECLAPDVREFSNLLKKQKVKVGLTELPGKNHAFPWEEVEFKYVHDLKPVIQKNLYSSSQTPYYKKGSSLTTVGNLLHCFGNPPAFNHMLFYQHKNAFRLFNRLSSHVSLNKPAYIATLCGQGGIGKTRLTAFYYWSTYWRYNFSAWFAVNDTTHLLTPENYTEKFSRNALNIQYRDFAKKMNLLGDDEAPISKCITKVKEWFEERENWFIVYDDVNNKNLLEHYFPKKGGHILLTSRYMCNKRKILMEKLSFIEAIKLANKTLNLTREDKEIGNLIKELDGLPLTITQACIYLNLNQRETDASFYREEIKHTPSLIGKGPLAAVLSISIDRIEKLSKNSILFLYCCSYLAERDIPIALVQKALRIDDQELDRILFLLVTQYQIILINGYFQGISRDNNTALLATIHPLVQEIMKKRCEEANETIFIINSILGAIKLSSLNVDFIHLNQLVAHIESKCQGMKIEEDSLSHVYSSLSHIENNLCLLQKTLEHAEKSVKLANTDLSKIKAINALSVAYWLKGDGRGGLLLAEQALALAEKNKVDHLIIARMCHNLAVQFQRQGQVQKAEILLLKSIKSYKELQRNDTDPWLVYYEALSKVILAYNYKDIEYQSSKESNDAQESVANAKRLFEGLSKDHKNNKELSKNILKCLAMVDDCYGHIFLVKKRKKESIGYFKNGLTKRIEQHGESHRLVAQSKIALAKVSKLYQAGKLLKSAYEIFFDIYGQVDNIYIANAYFETGNMFFETGDPDLAAPFLAKYLNITKNQILPEFYDSHFNIRKATFLLKQCNCTYKLLEHHELFMLLEDYLKRKISSVTAKSSTFIMLEEMPRKKQNIEPPEDKKLFLGDRLEAKPSILSPKLNTQIEAIDHTLRRSPGR